MCYAVSTGPNPLGTYYRYAFERKLFPDYPRPAVWPDGYYVPSSPAMTSFRNTHALWIARKCCSDSPPRSNASSSTE